MLAVPGSLTARKQADLLKARLHGLPERAGMPERAAGVPTLAKVLPHRSSLPALPHEPILARIDDKGRVKLRGALEAVGFGPGVLQTTRDGHWVVLRQSPSCGRPVRNAPRVGADGRLTVARALRFLLGVDVGDQVLVQPVPEAGALCLVNPAAVFVGAPLGVLQIHDQAGDPSPPSRSRTPLLERNDR